MTKSKISSRAEYERAMARIDVLMEMNRGSGPAAGTDDAAELEALAALAEAYEQQAFSLDGPSGR